MCVLLYRITVFIVAVFEAFFHVQLLLCASGCRRRKGLESCPYPVPQYDREENGDVIRNRLSVDNAV